MPCPLGPGTLEALATPDPYAPALVACATSTGRWSGQVAGYKLLPSWPRASDRLPRSPVLQVWRAAEAFAAETGRRMQFQHAPTAKMLATYLTF